MMIQYKDGQEPMLGDKVVCIMEQYPHLDVNKHYIISKITDLFVMLESVEGTWSSNRFNLLHRANATPPAQVTAATLPPAELNENQTSASGAVRHKCTRRFDLLVPEFIDAMAYIMDIGAQKYADENWKKGFDGGAKPTNHAMKHLIEYQKGDANEYGPQRLHLAQVAVNAMFEFWYAQEAERTAAAGK